MDGDGSLNPVMFFLLWLKALIHLALLVIGVVAIDGSLRILTGLALGNPSDPWVELALRRGLECLFFIAWSWKWSSSWFKGWRSLGTELGLGLAVASMGLLGIFLLDLLGLGLLESLRSPKAAPVLLTFLLAAVILGPLAEELFFRGILYEETGAGKLPRPYGWLLIAVAILVFAILHAPGREPGQVHLRAMITWSSCGLITFGCYLIRRQPWMGWMIHAGANATLLWPSLN